MVPPSEASIFAGASVWGTYELPPDAPPLPGPQLIAAGSKDYVVFDTDLNEVRRLVGGVDSFTDFFYTGVVGWFGMDFVRDNQLRAYTGKDLTWMSSDIPNAVALDITADGNIIAGNDAFGNNRIIKFNRSTGAEIFRLTAPEVGGRVYDMYAASDGRVYTVHYNDTASSDYELSFHIINENGGIDLLLPRSQMPAPLQSLLVSRSCAIDSEDNFIIGHTGSTARAVGKVNNQGVFAWVYEDHPTRIGTIVTDSQNNVYILGSDSSTDPVQISKLSPDGELLLFKEMDFPVNNDNLPTIDWNDNIYLPEFNHNGGPPIRVFNTDLEQIGEFSMADQDRRTYFVTCKFPAWKRNWDFSLLT